MRINSGKCSNSNKKACAKMSQRKKVKPSLFIKKCCWCDKSCQIQITERVLAELLGKRAIDDKYMQKCESTFFTSNIMVLQNNVLRSKKC